MRHRIFIAINLPENVKKELFSFQESIEVMFTPHQEFGGGPIRWTKPENLHITLVFLGYISDQELPEICKIVREVAQKNQPFSINLNRICYGPPGKIPRMVWVEGTCPELVEGKKIDKLSYLQENLENSLFSSPKKTSAEPENFTPYRNGVSGAGRPYTLHITLGRIRQWEFRKIEPEERPNVETDISLSFDVSSIEVMESELKRGGPEYTVLESIPLGSSL